MKNKENNRKNPKEIVKKYLENNKEVNKTIKDLGISRSTLYRWIKRSRSIGLGLQIKYNSLKRKSTRPKTIKRVLSNEERIEIEKLRLSREFDVRKIKYVLKLKCSHMTVYRFLKKKRMIKSIKNHRRPKYQDTTHMNVKNTTELGYIQMDVKYITPELSGLPWTCFEYGFIVALREILPRIPFKVKFIQTDNGLEFQKRFKDHCLLLGLEHHHIHKSTPNENAVIERYFRTDEEEYFFMQKTSHKDYDDLRDRFQKYLDWYNNERPHLGINLKTPIEIIDSMLESEKVS